jgi:tRNA threonylcarbamoyladenosine biosynthesis protein TsaB
MKILSIDTSNCFCSASLAIGDHIVDFQANNRASSQAEDLFAIINNMLDQNNTLYSDIDLFATTLGPGSFTGIRVGLATIIGIKIATGCRVVGLSNLEVVASNYIFEHKPKRPVVVALDARREQAYCQIFSSDGHSLEEPKLINSAGIKDYYSSEENIFLVEEPLSHSQISSSVYIENANAKSLISAIQNRLKLGLELNEIIKPLYIRSPDIN